MSEWRAALERHMPPTQELRDAGEDMLGPAAAAALVVFALDLLSFGKKAAVPASSWAMLIAFGVANYFRHALQWLPDKPFQAPAPPWHWLPLMFLLFQHDGMFGATDRGWFMWVRRVIVSGLAAWVFVPAAMRAEYWPLAAFAAVVLLGWVGPEALARQSPGGVVPLGLGFSFLGASFVMAHAHSASFADCLAIPGAALVGIALVSFVTKADPSGAFAGPAMLVPAILLLGQQSTFSEIPWYAFFLAALPPVLIGLVAIRPISRLGGTWRWVLFWALCLGPSVAAVVLAVRAETLLEQW
jgi:hypothetical protein